MVDKPRGDDQRRSALIIRDPEPIGSVDDIWTSAHQISAIGIFVILLGAAFYFCRPILMPVLAALVVGMTFAPLVKFARRHGVSPWVTAITLVILLLAGVALAAMALAGPISEWVARAPEIGAIIKQRFSVLDRPLAALRQLQETLLPASGGVVAVESPQWSMVTPVLSFVTPAVTEAVIFLVTLTFFLGEQIDLRRYLASFFASREGKLRFIRIANDIEENLASYLATVTAINFGLGVCVAIGAFLFGLPNPILFGALAMLLNYLPYIGAACMVVILLAVGLTSFPSLGYGVLPAAAFVGLATLEGQFITPTILGHRLTLNPLMLLLALAFWAWLWGPMGAFLAVPFSIIAMVTLNHLFPDEEFKLPE